SFSFQFHIRDFVPDNRCKIVESDRTTSFLNGCMKRNDCVTAIVLPPRQTDVSHHANHAASGNEGIEAMPPDRIQLIQKAFVVLDVTKLYVDAVIFFQCPVRRRRYNEMNTRWVEF